MRNTFRTWLTVAALAVAMACASIPAKQKAVTALQGSEVGLAAAQDTERQLCDPVKAAITPPAPITACTGDTAATIGLTTARHQQIAAAMAKAFTAQAQAATALQAWRSGDPAPKSLDETVAAATEAIAVVRQLTASNQRVSTLLGQLQDYVTKVGAAIVVLKGGK